MTTTEFKPKQRADRDVSTFIEFTGLRNDTSPERLARTDLVVANNVTLDNDRRLARRAGSTLRIANGGAHSLWAAGEDACVAAGPNLYRLNAALSATLLKSGMSGAPISYAKAGDNVYFTNGVETGVALASSTRSWGIETPDLLVTPTAGDLVPGRYGVTATYVRSDGQESGADAAQFVDIVAGQGVTLTVPMSLDADVVAKRFYMTTPNEEVLYHVGTLDDNDGSALVPTAADIDAMNEPLDTQFMGPPPAGQLVAYYKGRMFVAVGDTLYPSEPFAYELFDPRNYIQLDAPITMLAPLEDTSGSGLFIGTTESTGVLLGEVPGEFKYAARADYGVVQGALAYVDGTLYMEGSTSARLLPMWLGREGICIGLPGLEITNLTRERFTFTTDAIGAAMFDPDTSMFVATLGAGRAIVMNTETLTLTTFSEFGYNTFARAFGRNLGTNAAGLLELTGNDDNGLPINATIELPTTDFGTSYLKTIERLYVGYRSQADMALRVVADDDAAAIYTVPVSSEPGLATQRVKVGRGMSGRYWGFTLNNLDGTDFTLDNIDVKFARLERRINGRA